MFAGIIGVAGASLIILSGALSTTSGTSPVTSATRTITGAGSLRFDNIATPGATPQYQMNGGAWTDITEGLAVVVNTSIAVRCVLPTPGNQATFTLRNHASGARIEDVVLTRS